MKKTIGVFAHVDAGKTTFSEQLLYHGQVIRKTGRVDHQDAFMDTHDIEKRRGITIFSEQAHFNYNDHTYYLIDTPGHVDFSAEMERCIHIIDYGIIIISGIDGIQSHTETVYELLRDADKPIFFFVNKLDANHANYQQVCEAIQKMAPGAVDFMADYKEAVASNDEELIQYFFEEDFGDNFQNRLIETIKLQKVMPIFGGAALQGRGVANFMSAFDRLTATEYIDNTLNGYVYKVRYDEKGQRQTFIKLTGGKLQARKSLGEEKITEIRLYQGKRYDTVSEVTAGDICALTGVNLQVGQSIDGKHHQVFDMMPSLQSKLVYDATINDKELFTALQQLDAEDPALKLYYEPRTKEMTIGVMGDIQLEILQEVIKARFGFSVTFEAPTIIYKETITDEVIGCGHFEPLKHYAEVILKLSPNPGKGLKFVNACSTDHLTVGHQHLIRTHLFEKSHHGILTGSDLTDITFTLMTGRSHNKHTSGGDFREATIRALRQGLEQASNIILEPYYEASITIPMAFMGKVMTDITQYKGECLRQEQIGEDVVLTAHVPVATFRDYPQALQSITSGKGRMRLKVLDYRPCHNTEEVIEQIQYDKTTDVAYPSGSVFCTKGKGYTVPWDRAKEYMHSL